VTLAYLLVGSSCLLLGQGVFQNLVLVVEGGPQLCPVELPSFSPLPCSLQPGRARLLPPPPGPLAWFQLNCSRSLGAGPYQGQPLQPWTWQVGREDLLVSLPLH
jgi:hypothetical protein